MSRTIQILVIDDEQIVLDSVIKHLRKEEYEIRTVLLAPEALEMIDRDQPDIILTDLMMPEIDGLELMKRVKDKHPQIPIIMITGYATINSALQATQLGAFDYIAKPFTRAELTSVLRRAGEVVVGAAEGGEAVAHAPQMRRRSLQTIGDNVWLMVEADGMVLLGVERTFVHAIGKIQNVFLPAVGDELRQGSVYLQLFSTDLRSHTVLSPLSGAVIEINEEVVTEPSKLTEDPYGEGWLIRLKPSRFEMEIKELGL